MTRTVLIVDDNPNVLEVVARMLAPAGYLVRTATGGETGLRVFRESLPDVVLCDLHMPGPNGLWLTDRVTECAPSTAVVLMSGDAVPPSSEMLRSRIAGYLPKPFTRHDVIQAIEAGMRWSAVARLSKRPFRSSPSPHPRPCRTAADTGIAVRTAR